ISSRLILTLHAVLIATMALQFYWNVLDFQYMISFPLHIGTFFVVALMCHSELAATRPDADRLTEFYLCMSIGGALGGLFNAIIAPRIFVSYVEYPLVLALSCLARRPAYPFGWRSGTRFAALIAFLSLLSIALIYHYSDNWTPVWMDFRVPLVLAVACLLSLTLVGQPRFMALAYAAIFFFGAHIWNREYLFIGRNVFGTLQVERFSNGVDYLTHGNILHGAELMTEKRPHEPLTYYHHNSPIGHIFEAYDDQFANAKISLVGLGAGTMAAYAKPGQDWTFYEINPMIERVARDPNLFTYLTDCKATNRIVMGDGRQSIEQAPDGASALMAFDAFSSDAIPTHMLTREAIQLYLRKLAPHGILAFNISTRCVELRPTLRELARDANLACLYEISGGSNEEATQHKSASTWFVMARSKEDLDRLRSSKYNFSLLDANPPASLWTDDFSNLIETLRF
ncbi:MAG: hypothetical protein ACRD3W_03585, partial [Terriglobales bacterium]